MAVSRKKILKSASAAPAEECAEPLVQENNNPEQSAFPEQDALSELSELSAPDSIHTQRKKPGWFSPDYNKSRQVSLDQHLLAANCCIGHLENLPGAEYYKLLRTRILQRTGGAGGVTVMVTSALPAEGKTLTAINLALAFAREFRYTALLVDCDFRQQQVHKTLGFAGERGLSDYFEQDFPISELMVWPGIEKFTVISGGAVAAESNEILGSPSMGSLVHEFKSRYAERFVFFDAPPVLTSSDSLALAKYVDYVLLTVRAGSTSSQDVNRAVKLLPREKLIGMVMNHLT